MVLVSILACLWFLSILVASSRYLSCSVLIIICMYLLLRCHGSLFGTIMLPPLICRMLIYIFLLLSIIVIMICLAQCASSVGRFCFFGLATGPRVFTALTKPILFFCHCKGFHIVIYLGDILVLVHSEWAGRRAH